MEVHYYHVHEVWHALYNRAEEHHLRDPENKEVKDEDARRRQLDTHEGIMDMTFKDLRTRVANTAEFDSTLRQAYEKPGQPIQPFDHYAVSLVQQRIRRQQYQKRKKAARFAGVTAGVAAGSATADSHEFARQLIDRKEQQLEKDMHTKNSKRKGGGAAPMPGSPGSDRRPGASSCSMSPASLPATHRLPISAARR